jgi:protein involved in polysaccharide export with SLBB domain
MNCWHGRQAQLLLLRILLAGLMPVFAGCASSPKYDWDALLREFEDGESLQSAGEEAIAGDTPAAPVSSLPQLMSDAELSDMAGEVTIQPATVVKVTISEDSSLSKNYVVNDLGAIELGFIGPVVIYDMTEEEAAKKIKAVLENREFRQATVRVEILRASYGQIKITGAVGRQGAIQIGVSDMVSLNRALIRVGGITGNATGTKVRIIRGGLLSAVAHSLPGEEYALVDEEGRPDVPDVYLRNNDLAIVYSPEVQRKADPKLPSMRILVLGEVDQEGFFTFAPGERCTIMHLLFKIGGLPPYANTKAIRVIRRNENGVDEEFRVNAKRILEEGNPDDDFALEHGDRVIVPARRISLF